MTRRRRLITALVGCLAALLAVPVLALACDPADDDVRGRIAIATGSTGAVYYAYGTAYAALLRRELPGVRPAVLPTAASERNVEMVLDGSAQVAFTQADIAAAALGPARPGADAPARHGTLTALARLYDDYFHLVVRDDGPVRSLADLPGHRVSTGEEGSGTFVTATRLLAVAGIEPTRDLAERRLGLDDSVTALRAGRIDAFFFSGGLPVTAIAGLARDTRVRLVDLGRYVAPMRRAYGDYYTERILPGSTYGLPPVVSIGIANYLVVRDDLPEPMAYALTRVLITGRDQLARAHPAGARLNRRNAISTQPLRLHPGAVRYYRKTKT